MAANGQCFIEWNEHFVSKERGKRVVHYFLKDVSGESVLAVIGTERSIRHMFYVVAEEFLKLNEAENSVMAGYRWRSRREVVNWLTSMLSKKHRQGEHSKSPKRDHSLGVSGSGQNRVARNLKIRTPDIVWSGVAWTCGKQLTHFPAFCRNGITIVVQSFVFVMAEEERRHLAYIEDMYEDRKGQKKVKVRWFHHNQEVQGVVTLRNPHPKEVFITPYAQVISVECVDGPAIVLTREHYDKCVSILPEDLSTRMHLCSRQFKNNRVKPFKLSKLCGYFDQPIFSILDIDSLEEDGHSPRDNVRVGVKRPRSSRGLSYEPSHMNVKYDVLRRKLVPKYVKNRDSPIPPFKANEKIEVLCQDSGIRGCWFRCTVLQVTRRQFKVRYDDLKDEDEGGNLEEWISATRLTNPDKLGMRMSGRPTTRPARTETEMNVTFEVGLPVDAWWSDGWWEGIVTRISESGNGDVRVYVPSETLFLELNRKNIRVSRDWVGGRWVDLETKPDILSLIPSNTNLNDIRHESLPISPKEIPAPDDPPEPVDFPEPEPVDHFNENRPLPDADADQGVEKIPSSTHKDNNAEIGQKGGEHMEAAVVEAAA